MITLDDLGLNLEDKGNRYQGLCPFHNDSHPSFSIYKPNLNYICFAGSCGVKGSFADLVLKLTGQELKQNPFPIYESRETEEKLKDINYSIEGDLFDVHSNKQVLDYCWSIGLTDEFIETFEVKYFRKARFLDPRIKEPKFFYNRLMIPCYFEGKIYNYECRDYTKQSSIKVLYPLGAEPDILFNWDNIDKTQVVYRTEGIKGLAKVWAFGSKNVVSTFGQVLKPNQRKLLATLPNLCDIPDNDSNKIDKKTGLPRDNILFTIEEYDTFYPYELELCEIEKPGDDPNNLTRSQIKELLSKRKKASEILVERSKLFESRVSSNDYLKTIKQ